MSYALTFGHARRVCAAAASSTRYAREGSREPCAGARSVKDVCGPTGGRARRGTSLIATCPHAQKGTRDVRSRWRCDGLSVRIGCATGPVSFGG